MNQWEDIGHQSKPKVGFIEKTIKLIDLLEIKPNALLFMKRVEKHAQNISFNTWTQPKTNHWELMHLIWFNLEYPISKTTQKQSACWINLLWMCSPPASRLLSITLTFSHTRLSSQIPPWLRSTSYYPKGEIHLWKRFVQKWAVFCHTTTLLFSEV